MARLRDPVSWLLLLLVSAALLLAAPGVRAQEGGFEVRNAATVLQDGVYYLSARIDYRLSHKAYDALQNGIGLTFQLEVELHRQRDWMPDSEVATLRQQYRLSYEPLARSYMVRNLNSGDQQSYSTLYAALSALGRVNSLPLIDASLLEPNAPYVASLRAVLDPQALPGPLRMLAFWDKGLTLESDWYRWTLRD